MHLNLNPPTERSIDKVLRSVAESEDLLMSDQQLVEVRCQCNRDLRNALVSLQFLAAGRTMEAANAAASRRKVVKGNRR